MEIQNLMDHWSYLGLPVSLDMLEGEFLIEKHGNQAWVYLPSDRNGPNGNTLTSAFQAFSLDQNPHRLSLRNEDAGTMEQKLKTLLLQNPYTYAEEMGFEPSQPSRMHKWDDLKSMLNATDEELKSALRLVSAVEINGYWRIVDDICIDRVLFQIVQECQETTGNGCFDPVDGNKIVKNLGNNWGWSPVLARHCLELYASTTDGRVWELDTKRVCVELARWIIRVNGNRMKVQRFMQLWYTVSGLPVSLDMLEREISVEQHGDQSWISLTSVSREMK